MMGTICFKNAEIYTPKGIIYNGELLVNNGVIEKISDSHIEGEFDVIDCSGKMLLPGFIDIHVNGGGGGMSIDASEDSITKIISAHAKHGTTGVLITTISVEDSVLNKSLDCIVSVAKNQIDGAKILGIHLEGPFLSNGKRGAHQKAFLKPIDLNLFETIYKRAEGFIKILSLAPELEGAYEFIGKVSDLGIVVGFAHSEANYEVTLKSIEHGVKLCTHIFNGMLPFSHKEAGPIGAFLTTQDTFIEIISDAVHVVSPVLEVLYKVKDKDKIILVTDAVTPAGTNMKTFDILGINLEVVGNSCYIPNTDTLAGSALTMNKAVRIFKENTSCSLAEAVNMASINPATLLNIDNKKGSIEEGKDADLIMTDSDINVYLTMVEGNIVFKQ